MSEKTMLQAATLWGARALEIDDKVGSIQAGKLADLILVEGNPLDNYHDLEKINVVICDGEWLDPNALLADAAEYARTAQPSSEHRMDAYY